MNDNNNVPVLYHGVEVGTAIIDAVEDDAKGPVLFCRVIILDEHKIWKERIKLESSGKLGVGMICALKFKIGDFPDMQVVAWKQASTTRGNRRTYNFATAYRSED